MKKKVGPVPRGVSLEREIINFTMGQNLKKNEIDFLGWKPINIFTNSALWAELV